MEKIILEELLNGIPVTLPEFTNHKNIVYCCENCLNGKVYIGETKRSLRERWIDHKKCMSKTCKRNIKAAIYDAIRKYGTTNFYVYILEENLENNNKRKEREKYWISKFNAFIDAENSNGYNMTTGGYCESKISKQKAKRSVKTSIEKYGVLPINTKESRKKALETNRKNHNGILAFQKKRKKTQIEKYGMLAVHLPENKEKAKKAMKKYKEKYGVLPFNTKEAIAKAQKYAPLYRMIGCINRHLKILKEEKLEINAINYVLKTNDVKHMWQQHIPHVLNKIDELRKIDKWTTDMEKIFSNIVYDKTKKGIKKIIFKNDRYEN